MSNKRKAARGKDCTLQIPWCCTNDTETTVLAHVGRHGTAKRNYDDLAVNACSACHDAIDRRSTRFLDNDPELQEKLNGDRKYYIRLALERMNAA
jgi:hypothetical protein